VNDNYFYIVVLTAAGQARRSESEEHTLENMVYQYHNILASSQNHVLASSQKLMLKTYFRARILLSSRKRCTRARAGSITLIILCICFWSVELCMDYGILRKLL
jgi:hypothetical protein